MLDDLKTRWRIRKIQEIDVSCGNDSYNQHVKKTTSIAMTKKKQNKTNPISLMHNACNIFF